MEPVATEVVDDETKHDRQGHRLMSRERVETLLREYESSGLTQAEFARRSGLKYATFATWVRLRRLRVAERRGAPAVPAPVRFAQVQMPTPFAAELSVVLPDGVIVRGADAGAVAALVRALRA